jgi:hypothetical protein
MIQMKKLGNGWFSCPACGKRKRYTIPATAFIYGMGKVDDKVQMECPCDVKRKEQKTEKP